MDGDELVGVEVEHASGPGARVHGVEGGSEEIRADYVVNATGAWAGRIGETAGVDIEVRPSKGIMTIMNTRQSIRSSTGVGPRATPTSSSRTRRPPSSGRPTRRWTTPPPAVRTAGGRERRPDRHHARLLPPRPRGAGRLEGMTSIVGGKFTTYRMMAEEISDHVCEQFGIDAGCRTADVPLPGSEDFSVLRDYMGEFGLRSPIGRRSVERLGSRADEVLKTTDPNPTVCPCEGVTRAEVRDAISQSGADLNAVRIRTRASTGNCQGGFCCHRMASELHDEYDESTTRTAWNELLEERWKGQRHALWGEQLSQAMLNYALHATTQNRDHDPAEGPSVDFGAFDDGSTPTDERANRNVATDGGGEDGDRG